MEKTAIWNDIQKRYSLSLKTEKDKVTFVNPENDKFIDIYKEEFYSSDGQEVFEEYIVCFATQHRHFDGLDEVEEYLYAILKEEVLTIEFYESHKRRFGGEISKSDYENLTLSWLMQKYGYSPEYFSSLEYEIQSWSGTYDSGRVKICELNEKIHNMEKKHE